MNSRIYLQLVAALLSWVQFAGAIEVRVIDVQTRVPVEDIIVLVQGESRKTDVVGLINIPASVVEARVTVNIRTPGYARVELMPGGPLPAVEIPSKQTKSWAVYLSVRGVSNRPLRDATVAFQGQTVINTLVVDMKGDRSDTPYPSAARVVMGAVPEQKDQVARINQFVVVIRQLHLRGLYLIARIVVFKDDRLARARPEWAVRDRDGEVWHDRGDQ